MRYYCTRAKILPRGKNMSINVTVWNEYRHEKQKSQIAEIYPAGIHNLIKEFLECDDIKVTTATLDDPEHGLPDEILNNTDVLIWWGHTAHKEVSDELVEKIRERVYNGMGFLPIHSAHHSKPFKAILGTTGNLTWGRNQKAIIWNVNPTHPIAAGVPSHFELNEEMYGEPFFIPKPDDLIFNTWFEDGNLLRGGATFTRGAGKIFYFHPGHEECESLKNEIVQKIIKNAVYWCAPVKLADGFKLDGCIHQLEPVVHN